MKFSAFGNMKRIVSVLLLVAIVSVSLPISSVRGDDSLVPIDELGRVAEPEFVRNGVPWRFDGTLYANFGRTTPSPVSYTHLTLPTN